ncbi:dimethylsulfoxide reductase subunit B [Bacillus sp. HMF5848]|uniref:DMSO/selenate family reductase complex B subunit n=1 Tax=Bacillus sp. HMF5848 TaxID=2495421 RepID=UPI000F789383|nr:DMSO/selenate family reductase complex B subunit [Bacillus sp. HMF5848]RSK27560.1 dimethylsulfoxide reductase subunit B [Bacillus sp. HMF5848]
MQYGFYIDMKKCIGCKTCQIACKDKNDVNVGVLFRKIFDFEKGKYPNPTVEHLSLACCHCERPKCVENCPTGAMYKRAKDGLVLHDENKCIGCKMCLWSCPYMGPQYIPETRKVGKCDGCADLVDNGENPACVDSCIMRAIEFGDIAELRKKYGSVNYIEELPSPALTNPSIVIGLKD